MVLWFLLALMTGAAVLTVLVPLSRRASAEGDGATDIGFYRDQLVEIERDRERGALAEPEADAAKAEAGRRLLKATAAAPRPVDATSEPALRRRRAASALALSVVPLIGLAVYGALGSPHLVSAPPVVQASATPADTARAAEVANALVKIEAHLVANPNDAKAWDIVAPIYVRLGRVEDGARAYGEARRAGGDTAERLMGHGEALVVAANGMVSADARAAFARGVELDPTSARGRFYVALADEQAGETERAAQAYRELVAGAPANAPWVAMVQARLERLSGGGGPTPEQVAALPPGSVSPEMIQGMVGGLDARLREKGGSEAEWSRLVRSYVVLGRREEALERLGRARTALDGQPEARSRLDQLAADLGLSAEASRR